MIGIVTLGAVSAGAEPNTRVALVGGMLLDGYGGAPVHHAAILLENNRILAAGPASEITIPPRRPVIDTHGETMIDIVALANVDLVIKDGIAYRDSTRIDMGTRDSSR